MLIIFTRYPRAGQAKTRLIPALGPEGAARLQIAMTEHSLRQARGLETPIAIYYANGEARELRDWLGEDLCYQAQADGDLGAKMLGAFWDNAGTGAVIIGTDCPGIDTQLLTQTFEALSTYDLVLGPALDGGYYLIGLRRVVPELFDQIAWSTDQVLNQTLAIAQSLNLRIHLLPELPDIDRPEDLPYLPQHLL
ncbi:MAG: glycosyltransferase [Alkalinema sp. RU_4_3]|nr:glycosyltransferase [Alkalinema sp. RU_4_3]